MFSTPVISEYVVPTPVGVNRWPSGSGESQGRCPHARGGEPFTSAADNLIIYVVPTPVGVNRRFNMDVASAIALSPRPWG